MVQLLVVRRFLHAPKTRHPRRVERHVIAATLASQRRLEEAHGFRKRIENAIEHLLGRIILHYPDGQPLPGSAVVDQHAGYPSQFLFVRLYVGLRAVQSLLFSAKQYETDGPFWFHTKRLER